MKEVGAALGIGESRVSQIHSLAMVRLRARLNFLTSPCSSQGGGNRVEPRFRWRFRGISTGVFLATMFRRNFSTGVPDEKGTESAGD